MRVVELYAYAWETYGGCHVNGIYDWGPQQRCRKWTLALPVMGGFTARTLKSMNERRGPTPPAGRGTAPGAARNRSEGGQDAVSTSAKEWLLRRRRQWALHAGNAKMQEPVGISYIQHSGQEWYHRRRSRLLPIDAKPLLPSTMVSFQTKLSFLSKLGKGCSPSSCRAMLAVTWL